MEVWRGEFIRSYTSSGRRTFDYLHAGCTGVTRSSKDDARLSRPEVTAKWPTRKQVLPFSIDGGFSNSPGAALEQACRSRCCRVRIFSPGQSSATTRLRSALRQAI